MGDTKPTYSVNNIDIPDNHISKPPTQIQRAKLNTKCYEGDTLRKRHSFRQELMTSQVSETCYTCGIKIVDGIDYARCVECDLCCHQSCSYGSPICLKNIPVNKGVQISAAVPRTLPMVPGLIVHCLMELEARLSLHRKLCLPSYQTDTFQWIEVNLNSSEKLIQQFNSRKVPYLGEVNSEHLFGAVILFLNSLRQPLIPRKSWLDFAKLSCDEQVKIDPNGINLVYHITELPTANLDTLSYVILFLNRLVSEVKAGRQPLISERHVSEMFSRGIVGPARTQPDVRVEEAFQVTEQRSLLLAQGRTDKYLGSARCKDKKTSVADEESALAICDREFVNPLVTLSTNDNNEQTVGRSDKGSTKQRVGLVPMKISASSTIQLDQLEYAEVYSDTMPSKITNRLISLDGGISVIRWAQYLNRDCLPEESNFSNFYV